jgi:hypothetical protein
MSTSAVLPNPGGAECYGPDNATLVDCSSASDAAGDFCYDAAGDLVSCSSYNTTLQSSQLVSGTSQQNASATGALLSSPVASSNGVTSVSTPSQSSGISALTASIASLGTLGASIYAQQTAPVSTVKLGPLGQIQTPTGTTTLVLVAVVILGVLFFTSKRGA